MDKYFEPSAIGPLTSICAGNKICKVATKHEKSGIPWWFFELFWVIENVSAIDYETYMTKVSV